MDFYFIFFIAIVIFLILAVIFNKKSVVKRKLRKTPSKRISEFKNGDVAKITGKAVLIEGLLFAPLSGRECVYYYVLVERQTSSGNNSNWKTIIEEEISDDFYLEEGVNKCIIRTNEVKSYLVIDENFSSGFLEDATPELERYLHRHNIESTNLLGLNKTFRYKEGIIEPGEEVAVVGTGNWIEHNGAHMLEIKESNELPVFISDHPNTLAFVAPKENKAIKMHISQKHSNQKRTNKKLPRYNKSYRR